MVLPDKSAKKAHTHLTSEKSQPCPEAEKNQPCPEAEKNQPCPEAELAPNKKEGEDVILFTITRLFLIGEVKIFKTKQMKTY